MKRFEKYYNKQYSQISFYVIRTTLIIFILGLIIYYLAGKSYGAFAFISEVFKPFVLGIVLAYLLSPLVRKIEKKLFSSVKKPKLGRVFAVLLSFAIVVAVLGIILGIIVVTLTKSLSALNYTEIKEYLVILADQFSKFWTTIERQLASMNINLGSVGDVMRRLFNGVKSGASTLLFAVIFSAYFLLDDSIRAYWGRVLDVFTNEHSREQIHQFTNDANRVFSGYIRGQAIDATIVGTLVSVALLIAGIPYAVVIGILTGIGNLVPYVGPVVGFGSLIIVCLADGSFVHLAVGGIILAAVMFIDGNIINPRMLSSNVEVHPVLVIVALLVGGKTGGIIGMLVAVPVAALLKLQFEKEVERRRAKREMLKE